MRNAPRCVIVSLLTGVVLVATSETATSQQPRGVVSVSAGYAADIDELRHWDATIDGMERTGELVVRSRVEDRRLPGRTHESTSRSTSAAFQCTAAASRGSSITG